MSSSEAGQRGSDATWRWRELALGALLVILLYLAFGATVVLSARAAFGPDTPGALAGEAAAAVAVNLAAVLAVYGVIRGTGASWRHLGFTTDWRQPPPWYLRLGSGLRSLGLRAPSWPAGAAILGFVAMLGAVRAYYAFVELLGVGILEPEPQIDLTYFEHPEALSVLGVAVVAAAPFGEEVFFRGFLFGGLRGLIGLWPAAVASGLIFAVPHAQVGLLIPFTLIGVVLALAYARTGSLYTSMGVHAAFNFLSFVVLVLVPEARS